MLPKYHEISADRCALAERSMRDTCEKIVTASGFECFADPPNATVDDLPSMLTTPFSLENLKLAEKRWYIFPKKHDGTSVRKHFEDVKACWKKEVESRSDNWTAGLNDQHFAVCERRRKHFQDHVQNLLAKFDDGEKSTEEAAAATANLIRAMDEAIGDLKLPLANAVASME